MIHPLQAMRQAQEALALVQSLQGRVGELERQAAEDRKAVRTARHEFAELRKPAPAQAAAERAAAEHEGEAKPRGRPKGKRDTRPRRKAGDG
jgi:hypothetical protein